MKTAYEPDNTRSSIVVMCSLAVIVSVIAAIIGLSDKPEVSTIALIPAVDAQELPADDFGFNAAASADDEAAAETAATTADTEAASSATEVTDADAEPERQVIVIPTSEPTATPEVAAAVEPTPVPEGSGETAETTGEVQAAPSLPSSSGIVQGSFFTKGDENEGAQVAQNLITVSFAEDGSGDFQGVLDITYADGTHILLNMSGPLTWAPSNPQVEATLAGAFTLDAPIDADDVTADDAELSITSLSAGSGSLCTTKCFGFTFPPQ